MLKILSLLFLFGLQAMATETPEVQAQSSTYNTKIHCEANGSAEANYYAGASCRQLNYVMPALIEGECKTNSAGDHVYYGTFACTEEIANPPQQFVSYQTVYKRLAYCERKGLKEVHVTALDDCKKMGFKRVDTVRGFCRREPSLITYEFEGVCR